MKYNIGDIFIDRNFDTELRSHLYKIDEENGIKYYWLTYPEQVGYRDTYWTEEELDDMLNYNVEHISVKK